MTVAGMEINELIKLLLECSPWPKTSKPLWALFHQEWGKAHDAPKYDKDAWKDMQAQIKVMEERCTKIPLQVIA